ncbi:MAG: cupin domain-containing protein [Anaerolineae bacterium]|nr:cupin domain-containing protein [Anaerolineae bacterium]
MLTSQDLIRHFGLQPLPEEGGLYTRTYLSTETIPAGHLPPRYVGSHPFGSAILYLLTAEPDSFSALHQLPTDEVYHFYLGDPVELLQLHPDGQSRVVMLGQDVLNGQYIQHVVPAGIWQGSRLKPGGRWALLGTTMAPGYADQDYLPGDRRALLAAFPQQEALIKALTRLPA